MEKRLYLGIDESNHGRTPEVFVAVFSKLEQDILEHNKLPKRRSNANPLKSMGRRKYSFLLVNETDFERIPEKEFMGVVASSLIQEEFDKENTHLDVFIDGYLKKSKQIYAKDLISEVHDIPKDYISISSGSKFDQTYKVVNLADSIANHLFRTLHVKDLSKDKHYKTLLK